MYNPTQSSCVKRSDTTSPRFTVMNRVMQRKKYLQILLRNVGLVLTLHSAVDQYHFQYYNLQTYVY